MLSLNPYPEYAAAHLPWTEILPSHWRLERAKWLFQRMQRPVRPEDAVVTCFRDGTVTLRKNRRIEGFTESLKEIGYQGVRRGDLVIHAMDAFAGAIGVSDSDGKSTPVYSVCAPRLELNVHYYANVVREMSRSQWIVALAKGIRERSTDFRYEAFANEWLPFPPLEEQDSISSFVHGVDIRIKRLIRAKRRVIELLNEQKQALIHRAVTRGLDPNVRLKPSGVGWLGEIPERWGVWQIGHFSRVGNGSTPSRSKPAYWTESGYPWLNSSTVNSAEIRSSDQFVTDLALKECHLPRVSPGSVLVAITGQGKTRGMTSVLRIEATINQHLAFIAPDYRVVTTKYLQLTLTGAYRALRAISDDAGSTKGALTCGDIKHFRIGLPPTFEQNLIVDHVQGETRETEKVIAQTIREIELLREYRTRLIADVVTGKLDVRGVVLSDVEEDGAIGAEIDVADIDTEDAEADLDDAEVSEVEA